MTFEVIDYYVEAIKEVERAIEARENENKPIPRYLTNKLDKLERALKNVWNS